MNIDTLKSAWQQTMDTPAGPTEVERRMQQSRTSIQRYQREASRRRIYGSAAFALTLAMLVLLSMVPRVWPGAMTTNHNVASSSQRI